MGEERGIFDGRKREERREEKEVSKGHNNSAREVGNGMETYRRCTAHKETKELNSLLLLPPGNQSCFVTSGFLFCLPLLQFLIDIENNNPSSTHRNI